MRTLTLSNEQVQQIIEAQEAELQKAQKKVDEIKAFIKELKGTTTAEPKAAAAGKRGRKKGAAAPKAASKATGAKRGRKPKVAAVEEAVAAE